MTHPAVAIKREVYQLVGRQIETSRQPKSLTSSDLVEYHARSEKITTLYRELDQMVRTSFLGISKSILVFTLCGFEGVKPPSAEWLRDGGLFSVGPNQR